MTTSIPDSSVIERNDIEGDIEERGQGLELWHYHYHVHESQNTPGLFFMPLGKYG